MSASQRRQDLVEWHVLDLELTAPASTREVQHAVDEPEQMPLALLDAREIGALLGGDGSADPSSISSV